MLRPWVCLAFISVLALCPSAASMADGKVPPADDPLRLYGNEIQFDVERDGNVVGRHIVTFTRTDQGVLADSRVDVDVGLLFLSAYRFRYQAHALWRDGELQSIEASTNENGDYRHVEATRDAAGLLVRSSGGTYEAPLVPPTSHWNAAELKGGLVLNTMTGELDKIQVFDQGLDTVATRGGSLRARHYLYSGDLNGEIWYDSEGRWVKLRFRANDGSIIDYVCRRCRAPAAITEAE
ncbi:MAG TPA: DUF6134 family protein [Dongiaceae bacterium]